MQPYYDRDGITIYHGDCRDFFDHVPDCFRVDALLTDPPFGIGFSEYESHADTPGEYGEILSRIWTAEGHVENGWCGVFQAVKTIRQWAERFDRDFRPWAMCKDFGQVFASTGPAWRTDYCLVWAKGKPQTPSSGPEKGRDWTSGTTANTRARVEHPCSRPPWQMHALVGALSLPGDMILDPFMGSGTTLVAAKQIGRRAIGIEIEERYCEIAAKRLSQGSIFSLTGTDEGD